MALPHRTQILYLADIAFVTSWLNIKPGSKVIEAGRATAFFSPLLGYHTVAFDLSSSSGLPPNVIGRQIEKNVQQALFLSSPVGYEPRLRFDSVTTADHRDQKEWTR